MANKVLSLLLLFCITYDFCLSSGVPEVETPLGKILGRWETSNNGRKYAAFEGIPYAKPPVGDLRFEEPQPVEPWSETLNATQTYACLQDDFFKLGQVQGDEDCLYLNVYVPATEENDSQRNFDVLVSIHGGAFFMGSAHMMLDSSLLLDKDLIVVAMNYRLGILGFLSTEDKVIPGNNGMKDQVLALRWIKDHIASFGGNPDSITITGVSAGAASVHLHYFSPLSEGLFVRGISQSGTALCPWAIKENPLETAKKLAGILDCPVKSTSKLKQCLKEKPGQVFVESLKKFTFDDKALAVPFAPVIEKGSANPFLTKQPYLLLKNKELLDLPWITSTTTEEGLLSSGPYYQQLETVDSAWLQIAHHLLDYTLPASKLELVAKAIKDFYLGPGNNINKENFQKFTRIFTDRLFTNGAELAAKLQSRVNKSPVYYYLFNYRDGDNKLVQMFAKDADVEGVAHGEDLIYCYSSMGLTLTSKSDIDLRFACLNMLYSYATTGIPSFDGTDKWQPTADSELTYLNITGPDNMKLERRKNLAPIVFWEKLGLLENNKWKIKDEL